MITRTRPAPASSAAGNPLAANDSSAGAEEDDRVPSREVPRTVGDGVIEAV